MNQVPLGNCGHHSQELGSLTLLLHWSKLWCRFLSGHQVADTDHRRKLGQGKGAIRSRTKIAAFLNSAMQQPMLKLYKIPLHAEVAQGVLRASQSTPPVQVHGKVLQRGTQELQGKGGQEETMRRDVQGQTLVVGEMEVRQCCRWRMLLQTEMKKSCLWELPSPKVDSN